MTKETNNIKMGNYAQKSENFVWKLVLPKARKPSVKTIGHKISLYFIRRKDWPVLTENKQNLDQNNIKIDKFKKSQKFP